MYYLKKILIVLLFLSLIGAGFYFAMTHFPLEKFNGQKVNLQNVQSIAGSIFSKGQQVQNAAGQVGKVLGAQKPATEKPPVIQRTFESARYTYCKQVVEDYEKRYSSSTTSATPKQE